MSDKTRGGKPTIERPLKGYRPLRVNNGRGGSSTTIQRSVQGACSVYEVFAVTLLLTVKCPNFCNSRINIHWPFWQNYFILNIHTRHTCGTNNTWNFNGTETAELASFTPEAVVLHSADLRDHHAKNSFTTIRHSFD